MQKLYTMEYKHVHYRVKGAIDLDLSSCENSDAEDERPDCQGYVALVALFVDGFRLSVKISLRMGIPEEQVCPGPSFPT